MMRERQVHSPIDRSSRLRERNGQRPPGPLGRWFRRQPQCSDGDLRRAIEAERDAYGADAAVDVKLARAHLVVPFGIQTTERRQSKRTEPRNADLSAMSVAGKDEVHVGTATMAGDGEGVVRLMSHQDDGGIGLVGDGLGDVGFAKRDVVNAADDDVGSIALDRNVLVDEQGEAGVLHVVADDAGPYDCVVIAQDPVAFRAGESAEKRGATGSSGERDVDRKGTPGDEVAGDEEEVGVQGVDARDDLAEKKVFGVLFQVDVGDLHDAKAIEGRRKAAEKEGAVGNFNLVTADLVGIEGERGGGKDRGGEKGAASKVSGLSGERIW